MKHFRSAMQRLVVLGVFQAGVALAATLTTVSPDLGDTYGGVPITCKGSGFTGATAVAIGKDACSNLVVVNDTTITCIAPPKPAGKHDVTVTTSGGSITLKAGYEAWSPKFLSPRARVYQSDQGINSAEYPWYSWECTTTNMGAAFTPRDGAQLLYMGTNLFLLGGWNPLVSPTYETYNEVWRSSDLGVTWTRILDQDEKVAWDTGNRWRRRHMAACVVHDNQLYVMGGDCQDNEDWPTYPNGVDKPHVNVGKWPHYQSDVWSSPDGVNWTRRTTFAQWGVAPAGPRVHHMAASFKGKLYVMGGQTSAQAGIETALNDVWESSDGGSNWVLRLPNNPKPGNTRWSPRGMNTSPVVFKDKLWMVGGGTYNELYHNDVWSWDGVSTNWTQVLAKGKAPWGGRIYHSVVVHDDKLWVLAGGVEPDGRNLNDVWWSSDGKTWNEVKDVAGSPWSGTHAVGCAAGGGYIFVTAGNAQITEKTKSAWRLSGKQGAVVSRWSDLGGDAKHLYQPVFHDRPFRVANELGAQPAIQFFGRHFMSLSPKPCNPNPTTGLDPAYARYKDQGSTQGVFQVYVVGRSDVAATNLVSAVHPDNNPPYTLVGTTWGESAPYNQFGMRNGALEYNESFTANQKHAGGSGLADGKCRLVWVQHKEGSVSLGVGTSTMITATTARFSPDYTGWQELGCGFGFEDKARFTFGAVVIIPDEIISAADLEKLNKWARKWGSVSE